jgi:hypothetical protein
VHRKVDQQRNLGGLQRDVHPQGQGPAEGGEEQQRHPHAQERLAQVVDPRQAAAACVQRGNRIHNLPVGGQQAGKPNHHIQLD